MNWVQSVNTNSFEKRDLIRHLGFVRLGVSRLSVTLLGIFLLGVAGCGAPEDESQGAEEARRRTLTRESFRPRNNAPLTRVPDSWRVGPSLSVGRCEGENQPSWQREIDRRVSEFAFRLALQCAKSENQLAAKYGPQVRCGFYRCSTYLLFERTNPANYIDFFVTVNSDGDRRIGLRYRSLFPKNRTRTLGICEDVRLLPPVQIYRRRLQEQQSLAPCAGTESP